MPVIEASLTAPRSQTNAITNRGDYGPPSDPRAVAAPVLDTVAAPARAIAKVISQHTLAQLERSPAVHASANEVRTQINRALLNESSLKKRVGLARAAEVAAAEEFAAAKNVAQEEVRLNATHAALARRRTIAGTLFSVGAGIQTASALSRSQYDLTPEVAASWIGLDAGLFFAGYHSGVYRSHLGYGKILRARIATLQKLETDLRNGEI